MSIKYGDLSMNIKNKELCERTNQITLTILTYGHAKISTNWRGESTNRSFSFLYYIDKGGCIIETETKTLKLTAGNWYLIPSGCNFKYHCEDNMEHIYFHISLLKADKLDTFRELKDPLCAPCEAIPAILFDLIDESEDFVSILTIKKYIYETLLHILKINKISINQSTISECVIKAIKYITSNLTANLTTSEIATNAFVSKSKLTKHFKKELSMSIQEYLYNVILSEASQLLMCTTLSVSEISDRLGFSDQFYFSRKFRQKYGLSPRDYRKLTGNF